MPDSRRLKTGRLRAIGLAGQGEGVWLSDAEGEPVGPGILWSDTRSRELMSELLRRPGFDRRFFSDTGTHLQPCNTSMQLSWLRHYQPERLAQAHYLFFAKDWVRFRLTGVAALDFTDASTSLLNQHSGELSEVVLNEMGLADLQHLFPPRLAPDAPAGTLRDEVAALTGLPAATPVAAGALDVCSAALGCGAVNDGDIYTILGTTCLYRGLVCHGRQAVNEGTRYVTHTESGSFINLFPMQAGTPNIGLAATAYFPDAGPPVAGAVYRRCRTGQRRRLLATLSQRRTRAVFQPRCAGRVFLASASTRPARSCSGRCLKDWLTPSSTRFRATRRAARTVPDRRRRGLGDLATNYCRL
ncbi:L-xylulose/3-keto-L-gulonate kinase [Raoultella planticola]|uniref:L-xylulose/3-keto-L-gulonate kinase n=1 Tax=Raoultella planticola TaxID=575 RepID=A0A485CPE9_RAOPL|nr:L-xylulose/3-keto-L-gulonate kinase [Raoultella planticola]